MIWISKYLYLYFENIMSSPAFWKDLEKFLHLYKNRVQFPYIISASKQEVILLQFSPKQKLKLQASSIFLLANTIYCFCILCWCIKEGNSDKQLRIEHILFILIQFFMSACFMSIHFVVSFTPEVLPCNLNTIAFLEKKIQSKLGISFIIYFQNLTQPIIYRSSSNGLQIYFVLQ